MSEEITDTGPMCWPEQEAVNAWLKENDIEVSHTAALALKKAVTKQRVKFQTECDTLRAEIEQLEASNTQLAKERSPLLTYSGTEPIDIDALGRDYAALRALAGEMRAALRHAQNHIELFSNEDRPDPYRITPGDERISTKRVVPMARAALAKADELLGGESHG